MIVEAAPTFFSYCGKVVAPWNELPTLNANIEELKSDVKAIKHHLRIGIEDYKSADLTNTVQEATLTRK